MLLETYCGASDHSTSYDCCHHGKADGKIVHAHQYIWLSSVWHSPAAPCSVRSADGPHCFRCHLHRFSASKAGHWLCGCDSFIFICLQHYISFVLSQWISTIFCCKSDLQCTACDTRQLKNIFYLSACPVFVCTGGFRFFFLNKFILCLDDVQMWWHKNVLDIFVDNYLVIWNTSKKYEHWLVCSWHGKPSL